MKFKLIAFVTIMLSLTAYNIYGGIIDREEIKISNAIDETFNTIKGELSHRDLDIIIRDNLNYTINGIDISNGSATADIELTGVDLAQTFYELDMYHAFYRELSLHNRELFTEQIMDVYNVYQYILYKNIGNTQTDNVKLQLSKSNGDWNVNNIVDIYRALEDSSVSLNEISSKAYDNLESARKMMNESYLQEQPEDKTFEDYWVDYLFNFITNGGYVTEFPYEEQKFGN